MLEFLLGLSDRQVAEAVRCRIDFPYALAMEPDDSGFRHSVPADFREHLAQDNRADRLRDRYVGVRVQGNAGCCGQAGSNFDPDE